MTRLRLRVKEIAQQKGMTQASLHRAADINEKTLRAIYKDPYHHEVYYSVLYKIAKVLKVPITDLIEVEEE
jgi:transcriptional regulator with XRE-family HTH domain